MDWDLKLGGVDEEEPVARRRRTSSSSFQQPLTCLVDGCTSDLNNCRDYHRRHRVCHRHSKTPVVLVAGQEQRFCQQCSRFQSLIEFDDTKRSCRKRLDGHNRRRRKTQPESIYISPAGSGSRSNDGLLHPPSMIHQLTQPPVTYPAASATPTVWPPPFPAPSHPYMTASSSFGYAQTDVSHIDCALSLLSSGTQHQHQHQHGFQDRVCTSSSSSATNHCYDAFDDQDHHREPCRMFPFRWD